jgi:death-on-curing protein
VSGPIFLSEQAILDLHEDLIEAYGGPKGLDYPKVCSIAAYPRQAHAYAFPSPSIPALGARYAFAANRFHAFVDGNKRVALAALDLFLMQNGFELTSTQEENESVILALAAGAIDEENMIAWVERNCTPIEAG